MIMAIVCKKNENKQNYLNKLKVGGFDL